MKTNNQYQSTDCFADGGNARNVCIGDRQFAGTVGALLMKMLLTILAILALVVAITVTMGTAQAQ